MSKKRKNAGEGYGYMFSGAFNSKADAVKKEKQRKGSFVKAVMTQHGMRYAVMTPRTNPIRRRARKNAGLAPVTSGRMSVFHDKAIGQFTATKFHPKYGNLSAHGYTRKQAASNLRDELRRVRAAGTWRVNPDALSQIQHGDRVTILVPAGFGRDGQEYKQKSGKAVMRSSSGGWVLNMGGRYGTPAVADGRNIVKVTKGRRENPEKPISLKEFRKMLRLAGYGPGAAVRGVTREQAEGYIKRLDEVNNRYDPRATVGGPLFNNPGPVKQYESQIFDTSTSAGIAKAERYKARLNNLYETVDVHAIGLSRVQIVGRKHKGENPGELLVLGANPHPVMHSELRANPLPLCGKRIGGETCSRKPGHRGPCLPQGATMRPRSRLRHGWKPRAGNPSAAAIREDFTGTEADKVSVSSEPHMPAGDYAQLGELLLLTFKPTTGGQVQGIKFVKPLPVMVSDETARQIYFVGGDQNLGEGVAAFGTHQRGGLLVLGEARRIDYKQRKEHVPDPEADEWRHEFGEESGIRPTLLYDRTNKRILLEGGEYVIRPEGIRN
jgi:hypothetical protein